MTLGRISVRGSLFRCFVFTILSLLLLGLSASDVWGQEVPSRILVEGRPIALTTGLPTRQEGRLFVPLLPIAAEQHDQVQVDPTHQTIQVRLSHTGETRTFSRTTGEIWRDGMVLAAFPDAADVIVALQPETQQVPVDILAFLLDVSVQILPDEGAISIRRQTQVQLETQAQRRLPMGLNRVDYSEALGFLSGQYGHTLSLGGRGQLYDGLLTGRVELSGGSDRQAFNFLRGFMILERPSGQTWTGGDFTLARAYRIAATGARGFSLEQPIGSYRLSFFGGGALSASSVGAGQFSLQQYHTGVIGLLWTNATLLRGARGWGYGLGGIHFAGGDRRGSLFLPQLAFRGRVHQFQMDAGVGQFRVGSEGDRRTGPDFGIDVTDAISLRQHTLVFRAFHYGNDFLTPQISDALRGRQQFSAAWLAPLLAGLAAGASVTHTRVRLGIPQSTNTYTWTASYTNPKRPLPEFSIYQTIVRGAEASKFNNLLLSVSRSIRSWRPFFAYNRLALSSARVQSAALGTSVDLKRYGSVQVYQNISSEGLRSGNLNWHFPPAFAGRLQVSGGLGYLHQPTPIPDQKRTKLTSRLSLWARLPAEHTIQFSFTHSGFDREYRLTVGGAILSRAMAPARVTPTTPRPFAIEPSKIQGRLYEDRNLNGRFDPGTDSPLAQIRLWIDSSQWTETNENGLYEFAAVFPGAHRLRVDFATLRADLTALNPLERILEVPARIEFMIDFSFVETGAVAGVVWFDANRNEVFDPGESPASDIRIVCSCGQDTLTAVDGVFILGELLPGEIYLSLDLQGLPPYYKAQPNRRQVKVVPGERRSGLRFALQAVERPIEERTLPPQQFSERPEP